MGHPSGREFIPAMTEDQGPSRASAWNKRNLQETKYVKQWVMGSDKEEQPPERQEMDQGPTRSLAAVGESGNWDPRVADLVISCKPLG